MEKGLWKIGFSSQIGSGAGVIYLDGAGKVYGGDLAIAYVGEYTLNGNAFTAHVKTRRHTQGLPSTFGKDSVSITANGTLDAKEGRLSASSPDAPSIHMNATMTKITD